MSHKYTVSVDIDGKRVTIPTIVPGNEALGRDVRSSEKQRSKPRAPTKQEVDRAVRHFMDLKRGFRRIPRK